MTTNTPSKDKRPPRSAAQWKEVVAAWQASGLSAGDYGARHNIGAASLWQWRRRLRRSEANGALSDAGTKAPTMLPVRVVETAGTAQTPVRPTAMVEVRFPSGHVVRVRSGTDKNELAAILGAVAEVCTC